MKSSSDLDYNFGNLTDGTVARGAKCSVGFDDLIVISSSLYNVWATNFWHAVTVGEPGKNSPDTVQPAMTYALAQVRAHTRTGTPEGYETCRAAGDINLIIVPAR